MHGRIPFTLVTILLMSFCLTIIQGSTSAESTSILSLDFEVDDGSLTHGGAGDPWEWGEPGTGSLDDPGPGSTGSGDKAWGSPLNGNYPADAEAYLGIPVLDTSSYDRLSITFLAWFDLLPYEDELNETGTSYQGDEVIFQGSLDGVGWFDIRSFDGTHRYWDSISVDLTEHTGGELRLRFLLRENGDGRTDNGFFIDKIEIDADELSNVDISLSSRSFIPSMVVSGRKAIVLLEASNDGVSVPEGTVMTLYIEASSGDSEMFRSVEVTGVRVTTEIIEWYPSGKGNFRGWINLTIGGSYHEGRSFSMVSHDAVFYDDAGSSIDHWNVGGTPPSVTWQTMWPAERAMSLSSSSVFWCGGEKEGQQNTSGFTGEVKRYLESDWIDLRFFTSSSLHIYHSYYFEGGIGASGGVVEVLGTDGEWSSLDPLMGNYGTLDAIVPEPYAGYEAFMGTSDWTEEMFDLGDLVGERTRIRFVLVSGDEGTGGGWYIDDILVSGLGYDPYDTDPPVPIEGLQVEVVDEGAVSLDWYVSLAHDFSRYNIYLEEDQFDDVEDLEPYETLSTIDLNGIILTGLEPIRTYWCAVTAEDINGNMNTEVSAVQFQPTELDLNEAPVALIDVEGGFYTRTLGEDVVLDGSGSYDPEGDPLTYTWTLPDGEIRRGSRVTWRSRIEGEDLVFVLKVIDGYGKSSEANVSLSFVDDGEDIESGQSIVPFLLFIAPFAIIIALMIVFLIFIGKGRRKGLEERLKKVGLEMDNDGRLVTIPGSAEESDARDRTAKDPVVLDVVQVSKKERSRPPQDEAENLPAWKGSKKPKGKGSMKVDDHAVKVVLECPYCGNSFKSSVKASVIKSGSPFDVECPHCHGKGTIND